MNRYPLWKYIVILVALVIGMIYTTPNFFGESPAVQVSSQKATIRVDEHVYERVQNALTRANITPEGMFFEQGAQQSTIRVRFEPTQAELQLQEIVSTVMTICLGPESLTNPVILRQLPHKDFVTTLDVLCEQFLKSAQRSRRVVAVCLNILATIPTKQDNAKSSSVDDVLGVEDVLAITDAERTALQQHLQTLHTSTWSRMQQHISTMLDARSEIHSQLQIDELKQVWDHCMDFVSVAGRIYNTKGMLLLHTLLRQARDSLEYLHKSQLLMLQNLLHEELWKPALVPSALQNELTHLQENPRVDISPKNDF